MSGEDTHVLSCPLLLYAGLVYPPGLHGLWKVINNVYIITPALVTFSRLSSDVLLIYDLAVWPALNFTLRYDQSISSSVPFWQGYSLLCFSMTCAAAASLFELSMQVSLGQEMERVSFAQYSILLVRYISNFLHQLLRFLYILSKCRKWNYGGSKFICSLCIEIFAAAIFSRLSD